MCEKRFLKKDETPIELWNIIQHFLFSDANELFGTFQLVSKEFSKLTKNWLVYMPILLDDKNEKYVLEKRNQILTLGTFVGSCNSSFPQLKQLICNQTYQITIEKFPRLVEIVVPHMNCLWFFPKVSTTIQAITVYSCYIFIQDHLAMFSNLKYVKFYKCNISSLEPLKSCQNLKYLSLDRCNRHILGLEFLTQLQGLDALCVKNIDFIKFPLMKHVSYFDQINDTNCNLICNPDDFDLIMEKEMEMSFLFGCHIHVHEYDNWQRKISNFVDNIIPF